MTLKTAERILAEHGIAYRLVGQWIEVRWDIAFKPSRWVKCPRTAKGLYTWLGY